MSLVVLGYGNPGRGDDGLGPSLLRALAQTARIHPQWGDLRFVEDFQLQVEHALDLADRELALFVDASTTCSSPYLFARLRPERDVSYTSHALTPAALLHVVEHSLPAAPPPAYMLAIRGECFDLGAPMSFTARDNLRLALGFAERLCAHASADAWEPQVTGCMAPPMAAP